MTPPRKLWLFLSQRKPVWIWSIYDTVTDPYGKERRVLNSKETTLAQQKQQAIKDAFQDWIWRDPDRRQELVTKYNELFNSTRPREYDGSHIVFSGMNPEIKLREHQLNPPSLARPRKVMVTSTKNPASTKIVT